MSGFGQHAERFWAKVDKNGPVPAHAPELGPCWPRAVSLGYAKFWHEGTGYAAHRVAWVLTFGDIPARLFVCHHCDNPPCCNPAHLFLGTNKENAHDMIAKGRKWFGPRPGHTGERNHQAKLTERQVVDMLLQLAGGAPAKSVADKFGVHLGHVQNIAIGRKWKHIPRPLNLSVVETAVRGEAL